MRVIASDNKPVALWAVPRSISTAFEQVFVERDDFEVLHEPFSASYYYGEDRLSDRYANVEPRANNYERVLESILAPRATFWEVSVWTLDGSPPAQPDYPGTRDPDQTKGKRRKNRSITLDTPHKAV